MTTPKLTDIDQIMGELRDIKGFFDGKLASGVAPLQEELTRLGKAYKDVEAALKDLRRDRAAKVEDGRLRAGSGRFAGLGFTEMKLVEEMLQYWHRRGQRTSLVNLWLPELLESRNNLRAAIGIENILAWEDGVQKRQAIMFPNAVYGASGSQFRNMLGRQRAEMVQMVTRALDSTTAGKGDELVPTFESSDIWLDVNLETLVLPLLQQVAMPTNPYDVPIQFGDTNWYPISENVAGTTTDPATQKVTLTAKGLKTGVPFSDELEEDSIVPFAAELRSSLARNAAEIIDDVLLNADQTVTNGINSDGATIAATTAGKAQWLLGFDGIIHAAIIDNSANMSINKTGVPDADIYNRVLAKMGRFAASRRRGEVVYVADIQTALRSLAIAELETIDTAGLRATMSTGEIAAIYGNPLIRSEQMKLADTDGKVTDSGNGTNTGRILCFNTTQWRGGFRRQITMEADRDPGRGQTVLYVSLRIALTERTGTRSTQEHTAIAYNVLNVTA